jgi:hypothetical protein
MVVPAQDPDQEKKEKEKVVKVVKVVKEAFLPLSLETLARELMRTKQRS